MTIMTPLSIMKKILGITVTWAVLVGLTMLVLWVDGFWWTLGVMWLTCVIASATAIVQALVSGKVRLVLPTPTAPDHPGIAADGGFYLCDGCDKLRHCDGERLCDNCRG